MECKLRRALEIKRLLDSQKALYDELDAIITELLQDPDSVLKPIGMAVAVDGHYFSLVNNFADKNTVWKPVALKAIELKIQTEEEYRYSLMSKSEKAAYTRAQKKDKEVV